MAHRKMGQLDKSLLKNASPAMKRASGRSRTKVANAVLISRMVLALSTWICIRIA
jgi:hypothetical protein